MFVSARATILHADLDAFYASVEQRDDPWLRGKPVVVGGGVVLAASYEAKAYGIKTPMPGRAARALCPHVISMPPRMNAYSRASKEVFAIFDRVSPVVEGVSIDEAFLDVSGLRRISGEPADIAARLRATVMAEVGLPITVGVARTKFLAKVASGVAKPDGLLVVPPDRELEFLHPLPVERLWGVGKVTAATLHAHGLRSVADIAKESESDLVSLLGRATGRHLHALATGHDPRPVHRQRRRSMGAQHALGRGAHSIESVDATLQLLVDKVAGRMRRAHRIGRTVVLRLRFADYTRVTRSHTLGVPTTRTDILSGTARALLESTRPLVADRGLTLIGVAVTNLDGEGIEQLELPFDQPVPAHDPAASEIPTTHRPIDRHALDTVLDDVHDRFGAGALTSATLLGRDHRQGVPMLPD
ncbi:DNA polymerase IV [Rhodococcus artemisiae]|uniref:DNA polymerase IV n=1 Tax=Rhodococcus artemisiae TaxID=714159 RepID=A0ABU7LB24_9NOCA|nr:DNA polymerase IV [Rhodococcus artemisiae]MEE2058749.1 DNA polymerase IV [Rhodococcus artemisiae]